MIKGLFAASRFVIGLAVIATFAGSVVLLLTSTLAVGRIIRDEVASFGTAGVPVNRVVNHVDHLAVQFIQITDVILLGTVLYIVSLGLYQLFIDQNVAVPRWLRVTDLTALKRDIIGVTVVLLGVTFLGEVVDWNVGDTSILSLGAGVALVIAALGLIFWLTPSHAEHDDTSRSDGKTGEFVDR